MFTEFQPCPRIVLGTEAVLVGKSISYRASICKAERQECLPKKKKVKNKEMARGRDWTVGTVLGEAEGVDI